MVVITNYSIRIQVAAPYEKRVAAEVAVGPVTVAFAVVDSLYMYSEGTYDETECVDVGSHIIEL